MFSTRDRVFGLHFNFTLSKFLFQFEQPFTVLIRVEEFYKDGSKFFLFPALQDNNNLLKFNVNAQLPVPFKNSHQIVIIHILDSHESMVAKTFLTYHWLYRQKIKLIERKRLDDMRCIVPSQVVKCILTIERIGSQIACTPVSSTFWPTQVKELETECSILQCWVQQNSRPDEILPVSLVSCFPAPIFSLLSLDGVMDEGSFATEGSISYTQTSTISLFQDCLLCAEIVSKIACSSYGRLNHWIQLMAGNRTLNEAHSVSKHGFLFPQFNQVNCSRTDIVGVHMAYIHMLYASEYLKQNGLHKMISSFFLTHHVGKTISTILQIMWPCIFIGKENNQYKLYLGLANRKSLNRLILDNKTFMSEGDIVIMSPSSRDTLDSLEICLISWRDYKNAFITTCLIQEKKDFDHEIYEPIRGLGFKMTEVERGIFFGSGLIYSTSHIRPHLAVNASLKMASQLNASKMIRPLLCASDALGMIGNRLISEISHICKKRKTEKIPWHIGWVTAAQDIWESNHIVTVFDRWQNIYVQMTKRQ